MILLDTNVISEALRPVPSPLVIDWLNARFSDCAISSVTIFELAAGLAQLPPGKRRETFETAVARVVRRFGTRVYAFDTPAAHAAAKLLEAARAQGIGLHQIPAKLADLQIGGIATAYGLSLATRNVADFKGAGLELINPWSPEASA
ncbi:MAG: type II toxin-antitoxin system VapC family toxin [Hyphomonadaceae bacterium]|nr:type II toxin-antitoxin system VapC family toxin [Hyphomonadaceae bacterium]